jgi:anti-sigma B factor antagonist
LAILQRLRFVLAGPTAGLRLAATGRIRTQVDPHLVHAAARRRDGTDQQASSGHHVLLCALRYIVRNMNSAFPADILNLQVAEHGTDARVVTVTGEVDALTAPRLADVLTAQLAVARIVVANLDGVQFMSSAGLRVLFEIDELATKQDRCLRLVSNSPTVALVLETSGLREQFTVADNVPDALNNVRRRPRQ